MCKFKKNWFFLKNSYLKLIKIKKKGLRLEKVHVKFPNIVFLYLKFLKQWDTACEHFVVDDLCFRETLILRSLTPTCVLVWMLAMRKRI